jgi:hypothetical protein
MIRSLVLAALFVPALALAQSDSLQELRRSRANPNNPPGVAAQRRDQAAAAVATSDDTQGQLQAALNALRAGRAGLANELLERAESRLLTRDTDPGRTYEAVNGGPIGHLSAARAALLANDRARAQREIEAAMAIIGRR